MGNKVNWGFGHGVVLRAEVWLSSRKELREIGTVGSNTISKTSLLAKKTGNTPEAK